MWTSCFWVRTNMQRCAKSSNWCELSMKNRSFCNLQQPAPATKWRLPRILLCGALWLLAALGAARAGDAPAWMHAVVSAPLPAHDEKTDAVLLYSEQNVTVLSTDKIRTQVRRVYKILRPGGRDYGNVVVSFNPLL